MSEPEIRVPSLFARTILLHTATAIGADRLTQALIAAGLASLHEHPPAATMDPSLTVPECQALFRAIHEAVGSAQANVILRQSGRGFFQHVLDSDQTMRARAVPLRMVPGQLRVKLALDQMLRELTRQLGSLHNLRVEGQDIIVTIGNCLYCEGIHATEPICGLPAGIIEALITWVAGAGYTVTEAACRAHTGQGGVCILRVGAKK